MHQGLVERSAGPPSGPRGGEREPGNSNVIRFSAGNPRVEHVVGKVHLLPGYESTEDTLWALERSTSASCRVCIKGLPPSMGFSELCTYLGGSYEHVSEIRLVRREMGAGGDDGEGGEDGNNNALLVLLTFDTFASAEAFYREFHGRPFCLLDPEFVCRLLFVKEVELVEGCDEVVEPERAGRELASCPVCLERLEPSELSASGIVTTVCNHRFHNQCLRQWVDSSCPVCRYVQAGDCGPDGRAVLSPAMECANASCRSTVDLWMCLVCGHTGCGRYRGCHAAKHFEETGHGFALEVADGRGVRRGRRGSELVWDYLKDAYVHRRIAGDVFGGVGGVAGVALGIGQGGTVEASPGDVLYGEPRGEIRASIEAHGGVEKDGGEGMDKVDGAGDDDWEAKGERRVVDLALAQSKVDSVTTELTQLMVSQMEIQRQYYEGIVESHHKATEKALDDTNAAAAVAHAAAVAADAAAQRAEQATRALHRKNQELTEKLEKSRKEQSFLRELNETLLSDTKGWRERVKTVEAERDALKAEVAELTDQVKDLMMFIEARDAIEKGGLGADAVGGTVSVGPGPRRRKQQSRR